MTEVAQPDEEAKLRASIEKKLKKQRLEKEIKQEHAIADKVVKASEQAKERHELEDIAQKKTIALGKDASVLFSDVRMIYPALDANPEHCVILTVPFVGIRTKYNAMGEPRTEADTILTCITSNREIFEASQEEFLKREIFARVPQPVLEQRFSAGCLSQFLYGKVEKVDPYSVGLLVKDRFEYYMDFGENKEASSFCTVYTIGTYFYFLFEYFAYLKLGGVKGSAKSKLGKVFQAMTFNANNSSNQTEAAIYRFARETRGTMIIDEGEELQLKKEERAAYQAIILSGYERTGSVIRINTDSGFQPEKLPTYCPKIICSIGGLMETLEDRAFEIILLITLDTVKSEREVHQASKEWTNIRDSLFLLLMQNWKEIQKLESEVTNTLALPGRLWSISKPYIVIARLLDKYAAEKEKFEPTILEFIKNQRKKKQERTDSSLTGSLLDALDFVLRKDGTLGQEPSNGGSRIAVSEVLEKVRELEGDTVNNVTGKYGIQSRAITRVLSNLLLYNEPKRTEKNGAYSFKISLQDVSKAKARLGDTEALKQLNELKQQIDPPSSKNDVQKDDQQKKEDSLNEKNDVGGRNNASVGSVTFSASVERADLVISRRDMNDGSTYVRCKEHPDGYFLVPGEWHTHLQAFHANSAVEEHVDTKRPPNERSRLETALEAWKQLEGTDQPKKEVKDEDYIQALVKTGKFNDDDADRMLKTLYRSGQIYETKAHYYRGVWN